MSIFKITSVFEIAKRGNPVNLFTIQEAELELSTLRKAGEKMAEILRKDLEQYGASSVIFYAIQEWEAANK